MHLENAQKNRVHEIYSDLSLYGSGENATARIQAAIDEVSSQGGGVVTIHPGQYTVGTLVLKSGVYLHLLPGAELVASLDEADYLDEIVYYPNAVGAPSMKALLYARNVVNIGILGQGRLVGRDRSFWSPQKPADQLTDDATHFTPNGWRPMMILFDTCQNIKMQDIHIADSPCYTAWMIDCQNVAINGVTVSNHFHGPNTDGIHLSSCQNVHVAGCSFHCGDDCIAIDGDGRMAASNIIVSNCIFESLTNAVRVYVGLEPFPFEDEEVFGEVTQVHISNCSVRNAAGGINVVAKSGKITKISVDHLTSTQALPGTCLFLQTMNGGSIGDVSVSNVDMEGNGVASMVADAPSGIFRVAIRNSTFQLHLKEKEWVNGFPDVITDYTLYHQAPWTFYCRHVHGLKLEGIDVVWSDDSTPRPLLTNYHFTKDVYEDRLVSLSAS